MNEMKKEHIRAIGNFLAYYYTDLNYIKNFQDFKEGTLPLKDTDYVKKNIGTFYSFLIEYKVTRNFTKGAADKLLKKTLRWVNSNNADDVDRFTEMLKVETNLTRRENMTSLASKILFLNSPWTIIPMDKRTRNAFKQKANNYSLYKKNLDNFRQTNESIIKKCLFVVKPLAMVIENDFKGKVKDINTIRENRIIDKLLMYTGKNA